jgi:TolB-like protein/Tfp pilus assembly protein PilF
VVVIAAVAIWKLAPHQEAPKQAEEIPRIVVLPFENLGSPDDEYFADGISEEITSRLAAVRGLQVISRMSAMQYKDNRASLRQIGEELDVGYVLEGTIRWDRAGEGHGRVRITPQLIRVADDSHLWSERYDRVLEDIFTVQSDIAEEVIAHLETTLLDPERDLVEARPTDNMEAYQAYLLGNQYKGGGYDERYQRLAVEMYERAVALDPEFALAHAALCYAQTSLFWFGYDRSTERLDQARASGERALALQPGLPEGHRALGWYYLGGFSDFDRALDEFRIAEAALPNDSNTLYCLFSTFELQGQWDKALVALDRWQRADPQGYWAAHEAAMFYTLLRDYQKAEAERRRSIAIGPDVPDGYADGAWTYVLSDGTTKRARALLESAPDLGSPQITHVSVLLDLLDRNPDSALAQLEASSIDWFSSLAGGFEPKELLECRCLSAQGAVPGVERACGSAVERLEPEIQKTPKHYFLYSALGHALAFLGRKEEAVAAGEHAVELMPISKDATYGPGTVINLAQIYTRVGESDKALDLIEKLLSIPCHFSVGLLRLDPAWDPLRDHPRFQALLEKYGTN